MMGEASNRSDADGRFETVCELTTLTLLIDAGVVTKDQALARLREMPFLLPEEFRDAETAGRVEVAMSFLRRYTPRQVGPEANAGTVAAAALPAPAIRRALTPLGVSGRMGRDFRRQAVVALA